MKKILDHIIWILIVVTVTATAIVSIVSSSLSHSGNFFDIPWWLGALLLLFNVVPWLFLALELLITIRDSSDGRKRSPAEITFNVISVILVVSCAASVALEADSLIIFALPVLWMIVRIIDAIVFRGNRERTCVIKSPVFLIVTAVLVVLTMIIAIIFCDRGEEEKKDYEGKEFTSDSILEAWDGEFDEEKLKTAIAEYEKSCSAYVLTEAEVNVPFFLTLNYEPKSAKVVRLAPADQKDSGFELKTYIDMTLSPTCVGNNVAVEVAWWYSEHELSWTRDYTLWSYLLRVKDTDGGEHYYYFRVSYSPPEDDTGADTDAMPKETELIGTVVSVSGGSVGINTGAVDPNDPFGGVEFIVTTTLTDGREVIGIMPGDTVKITYDGMVAESYPMQIFNVYSIQVIESVNVD